MEVKGLQGVWEITGRRFVGFPVSFESESILRRISVDK